MQSYLLCFICNLQDMRYFFLMLVFLLVSFGLTFSVLMSPISSNKLNLVSAVGSSTDGAVANSEVQVFGSLEVRCNVLQGLSAGAALAHGLLSAQLTCFDVKADDDGSKVQMANPLHRFGLSKNC